MKDQLIAAARLAREASQGRRSIEICVTEIGVIIRGATQEGVKIGRASRDYDWPEVEGIPDVLTNAVVLVDRDLSAMESASL